MDYDIDYTCKIILVGDSKVGKTTFFNLLQNNKNFQTISTIGVDYTTLRYNVNGKQIKIIVWDTAGQDRFNTIIRSYFRNICGVILMYDLTNMATLQSLEKWLTMINYENKCRHHHPLLLIGNKKDKMDSNYKRGDLKAGAFDLSKITDSAENLMYLEMSCMNSDNVFDLDDMFSNFIKIIINNVELDNCTGIKSMKNIDNHSIAHNEVVITNKKHGNNNKDSHTFTKNIRCCKIS